MKRWIAWGAGALVTLSCGGAIAAAQKQGDWQVDSNNEGFPFMYSMNESGSMFGKWCSSDTCYWMLVTNMSCGSSTELVPVLLNGGNTVATVDSICSGPAPGIPGMYRLALTKPDLIDTMLARASQTAFAIGTENTGFRVFRFSTSGFAGATRVLTAQQSKKPPPSKDSAL